MPWSKNFDVEEALDRATDTFWSKGYQGTSMRDLLEAMGIQKGSFYDTYGSKHAAFIRALEKYSDARLAELRDLGAGQSPRQALAKMFNEVYADCVSASRDRGCMLVNCALEVAPRDPKAQAVVQRGFGRHEDLMRSWITQAQSAGEVDPAVDARAIAKTMLALIMGMRVHARVGSPKSTIKTLAAQAMALLGN